MHEARVAPCPPQFHAGYYLYGNRRAKPGRPPRWIDQLLQGGPDRDLGPKSSSIGSALDGEDQPEGGAQHASNPAGDSEEDGIGLVAPTLERGKEGMPPSVAGILLEEGDPRSSEEPPWEHGGRRYDLREKRPHPARLVMSARGRASPEEGEM